MVEFSIRFHSYSLRQVGKGPNSNQNDMSSNALGFKNTIGHAFLSLVLGQVYFSPYQEGMFEYIHRVWFKRSFCLSIFISFSFDLYFRWHSITRIAFFCFCWTFNWALHLFWNIWNYQCAALCLFYIFIFVFDICIYLGILQPWLCICIFLCICLCLCLSLSSLCTWGFCNLFQQRLRVTIRDIERLFMCLRKKRE